MLKLLPLILLSVMMGPMLLWAEEITIVKSADNVVQASKSGTAAGFFTLIIDGDNTIKDEEEGHDRDNPLETYIPLNSGRPDYFTQASSTLVSSWAEVPTVNATETYTGTVRFNVTVLNKRDTPDTWLTVAVQKSNDTFAVLDQTRVNRLDSATAMAPSFSLQLLCEIDSDHCPNGSGYTDKNVLVAVFLSTSQVTIKSDITFASTDKTGVYYKLFLSDQPPTQDVYLTQIKPGDGRAFIYFDSTVSNYLYQAHVVMWGSNPGSTQNDYYSELIGSGGTIFHRQDGIYKGMILVKGLFNGATYYFAVYLVNKFQFASRSSDNNSVQPMEIETFLQKQMCFLLSAGFQKEHYVLDYFRHLRDDYLKQFHWGREFVAWYYLTAPAYAPAIYQTPALSFLVRCLGFVGYFLGHYFIYWMTLLAALFTYLLVRPKTR
jgi:hypothetical protein